jgi:hypothetical protein
MEFRTHWVGCNAAGVVGDVAVDAPLAVADPLRTTLLCRLGQKRHHCGRNATVHPPLYAPHLHRMVVYAFMCSACERRSHTGFFYCLVELSLERRRGGGSTVYVKGGLVKVLVDNELYSKSITNLTLLCRLPPPNPAKFRSNLREM